MSLSLCRCVDEDEIDHSSWRETFFQVEIDHSSWRETFFRVEIDHSTSRLGGKARRALARRSILSFGVLDRVEYLDGSYSMADAVLLSAHLSILSGDRVWFVDGLIH